jgi:prolyl-tRNA synthetase
MHKSERLRLAVEELYGKLCAAGVDVLFDDRQDRLGVMLNDIELLGIPHRLIISDRGLDAGTVEYQGRRETAKQDLPLASIVEFLQGRIDAALA